MRFEWLIAYNKMDHSINWLHILGRSQSRLTINLSVQLITHNHNCCSAVLPLCFLPTPFLNVMWLHWHLYPSTILTIVNFNAVIRWMIYHTSETNSNNSQWQNCESKPVMAIKESSARLSYPLLICFNPQYRYIIAKYSVSATCQLF